MKQDIIRLARAAISLYTNYKKIPQIKCGIVICDQEGFTGWKVDPILLEKGKGVYVELYKNGVLRGRMGTAFATKENLGEELIQAAVWACSKDPEFEELTAEELDLVKLKVYILEPAVLLDSSKKIGAHSSVLVSCGWRNGLELWDGRTSTELYEQAIKKASVQNESFLLYALDTTVIEQE